MKLLMFRRDFGQILILSLLVSASSGLRAADGQWSFDDESDRIWVGPDFWANRLHDWRIADGRVECVAQQPRLKLRTLSLLTYDLNDSGETFQIQARIGFLNREAENVSATSAAGFLIGIGPEMNEKSRAIIHGGSGDGSGWFAGIERHGKLILSATADPHRGPKARGELDPPGDAKSGILLTLIGTRNNDGEYDISLSYDVQRSERVKVTHKIATSVSADRIRGGIALVSHPGDQQQGGFGGRWWFDDLAVSGDKITAHPDRRLGPILSTQYTIDTQAGDPALMKLTAQLMPIAEDESHTAALQVQKPDGSWKTISEADVVVPGWTATFRDDKWIPSVDEPYRVVYPALAANLIGGSSLNLVGQSLGVWQGTFRKDPADKESIVVAGFTGNHNCAHNFERPGFDFNANIWFPHTAITDAVAYHNPDLLFFSGDQVYEGASPTFPDTNPENIKLDYLYKWYLWCWAYRDLAKEIPCIIEPDDHDVYQGNIWGQGGRQTVSPPGDRYNARPNDHDGGYVHPADFVKMVERTQTSHLPDPYDPAPLEQGITSYYTDLVWGKVGIAILEDRKFKSGCNRPDMPHSGTGRPDHFNDPAFDVADLDRPGLTLLGEKQLEFLNSFAEDWQGQEMKMAVSQTIFANMATHHGGGLQRLIADLDSNGWPQSGRNRAMQALRRGNIFHLAGDQHLATIVHHGIERHGDAVWSFCVPSVANFYPRAWAPKDDGEYTNPLPEDYTGDFYDGFGHPVTVYAATNPGKQMGVEPVRLHNGMPGYGIVRLNKTNRKITMECWPRSADPSDPEAKQYLGWPMTIQVEGNDGD